MQIPRIQSQVRQEQQRPEDNEALRALLQSHQQHVQQLNQSLEEQRARQMQMLRDRFEQANRGEQTTSSDGQAHKPHRLRNAAVVSSPATLTAKQSTKYELMKQQLSQRFELELEQALMQQKIEFLEQLHAIVHTAAQIEDARVTHKS